VLALVCGQSLVPKRCLQWGIGRTPGVRKAVELIFRGAVVRNVKWVPESAFPSLRWDDVKSTPKVLKIFLKTR